MLDDGYEFTDNIGNIHSTLEKGATNREMRYNIWLKNNKPNVGELDNIIDEMSDDDIIYMLTQTNSYSRDVHKNLLEKGKDRKDVAASIRTALKTVPILSTPMILNFENDPQSSFAEGGEVGDKKAKYPHHDPYLTYEFVGTPADSTQWINDYKKIYGFADGGEVDPRQNVLRRANKVATNYSDAKDFTLDPFNYAVRKIAKTLTGRGGISNCTLSATGWVDPNNQYMSARNLFNNPESGYIEIDKAYALPGDLLVAKNPEKDSYHTMLIEEFNGDDPLLRYSRGGHDTKKNLVTGRSLEEYHRLDNEQGGNHTEDHYFRYNFPNEYWLPEVVVTGKKK